jgi:hypothetical protein
MLVEKKVVGSGDVVVFVGFDAFFGVIEVEVEGFKLAKNVGIDLRKLDLNGKSIQESCFGR